MLDLKLKNLRVIYPQCNTTFYDIKKNILYIYETLKDGNYKLRYIIKNPYNR